MTAPVSILTRTRVHQGEDARTGLPWYIVRYRLPGEAETRHLSTDETRATAHAVRVARRGLAVELLGP